MGQSHLALEVFNCSAPDTGNMAVLARYGTPEQQERWLKPLLAGEMIAIFMGKTDPPHRDRHRQQSMVLVPTDTPGIRVVRAMV
jgi:acyl-CoA dehydrogenase